MLCLPLIPINSALAGAKCCTGMSVCVLMTREQNHAFLEIETTTTTTKSTHFCDDPFSEIERFFTLEITNKQKWQHTSNHPVEWESLNCGPGAVWNAAAVRLRESWQDFRVWRMEIRSAIGSAWAPSWKSGRCLLSASDYRTSSISIIPCLFTPCLHLHGSIR